MLSRLLQYVIAGHHAGLADWEGDLAARLAGADAQAEELPTRPANGSVLPPAETRAPALERLRARGATLSGRASDMLAKGRHARPGLERLASRRGSRAS